MRSQPVTRLSPTSIANRLRRVFGEEAVDAAARSTGFMRRKREVTHEAERTLGIDLSTHRAAASARHYLDAILQALLLPGLSLLRNLREAFAFMRDNARRAHPLRDRRTGRLSSGLRLVGVQ